MFDCATQTKHLGHKSSAVKNPSSSGKSAHAQHMYVQFVFVMFQPVSPSFCPSAVMQINDQVQALNSTVQLAHGVELWKDQRGVSARIVFPNMTIFFDGNTAHVSGTES